VTDAVQKISDLREEREDHLAKRQEISQKISEIKDDIEATDSNSEREEYLKSSLADLKQELEQVNNAISTVEQDIQSLTGENNSQNEIGYVSKRSETLLDQLESEYEKIEKKQESLEESLNQVEEAETQVEDLEETARGLLEKSTSAALGDQFADRKSELESNLVYWKAGSIGTIILLVVASGGIYADIVFNGSNFSTNLSKALLIVPISVAVWFSVSNYTRQKRLMEEYEFKARMALSLSGFREVLQNDTTNDNDELVAEFVVDTMERIYTNPQQNVRSATNNAESDPTSTDRKPLFRILNKLKE
jgi:prefoldin subunit 5